MQFSYRASANVICKALSCVGTTFETLTHIEGERLVGFLRRRSPDGPDSSGNLRKPFIQYIG